MGSMRLAICPLQPWGHALPNVQAQQVHPKQPSKARQHLQGAEALFLHWHMPRDNELGCHR